MANPKKPARKPKAAKPVLRWMYKSARWGLIGGAFRDRRFLFTPFAVRGGKVVEDFSVVRVRIVEVRR